MEVRYECSRCHGWFEWLDMTYGHKAGGVGSWCKKCKSGYNREYWAKHREELKEKRRVGSMREQLAGLRVRVRELEEQDEVS